MPGSAGRPASVNSDATTSGSGSCTRHHLPARQRSYLAGQRSAVDPTLPGGRSRVRHRPALDRYCAIVPFTPIHRALGIDAGDITIDLIQQAVDARLSEEVDLDWKQRYNHRDPKAADELAKDIAAMANTGGGTIVYGVAENPDDRDHAGAVVGTTLPPNISQTLHQVAWNNIRPSLAGVQHTVLPYKDGVSVLVVQVPTSPDAPHLVMREQAGGDRSFVAPRRVGAHTEFMTERDLERAYREQFTGRERTEQSLAERFTAASTATGRERVRFVGVMVPHLPASAGRRLTREDAGQIFNGATGMWMMREMWELLFHTYLPKGAPHPGLRRWTSTSGRINELAYTATVHSDGTVTLTLDLDSPEAPQDVSAVEIEAAVVVFAALSSSAARHLGVSGHGEVKASLVWHEASKGGVWVMPQLHPMEHQRTRRDQVTPVATFEPLTATLPLDASRDETLHAVRELAIDLLNAGGVTRLDAIAQRPQPNP